MIAAILIAAAVGAGGEAEQAEEIRRKEVEVWRKAFDRQAKEYQIAVADKPGELFRVVGKPVFLWNQPVRLNQIGSVYVWLQPDGRPGAIGTLYCWKTWRAYWAMSHEFHSLAGKPLRTVWRGKTIWTPNEPGLVWKPLRGAQPPSSTTRMQLQQIRLLARGFQAYTLDKNGDRWQLRLLAKPLYDYTAGSGEETSAGALLAMCQGMDPELLLAIESRPSGGQSRWHYACGAFTDFELHVEFRGTEVWSAPATPTGGDPSKAYWRNRITSLAHLPQEENVPDQE